MSTATSNDGNLAFARQIFSWFGERDIEAFMAALAPDVEARPSIDGAPVLSGRDAVAEWWASIANGDSDLEVRPLAYEARGDCVIVRGYMRRRDGRTLAERQVYWVYEMRDGQIARMESHPSRRSALAACGP